ncbi:hypothetical protein CONPUDRAFT_85150 [Coniophora puteana RWD-64-598 SS2]|uniref:Uncharacterized protein n=1 Tax=Coniophora puteana (strain RWD-64-598) TaxID=741705 RepID=A0A5M3M9R1_CONPW|nr:uncharacterized protein CONPUDRAFT_85150 [Coniophora puteana RWD-64-598 SS2]EIW75919.1 hypothetical protein CONPUDRAFT_85150 [Coniophora puteana RWD-64-598 SS2]
MHHPHEYTPCFFSSPQFSPGSVLSLPARSLSNVFFPINDGSDGESAIATGVLQYRPFGSYCGGGEGADI